MTARLLGRWADRSPEWYAAREGRIGGSDIGVIMGWSPYKTRADLITEILEKPERKTTAAKSRGVYCEPAIAAWLADKESITYDEDYRGTWVNADAEWQMCNPDGVTTDGRLCEFKTCDVRDVAHGWGRAGGDQVPLGYAAQVVWSLGVLDLEECLLAVLSGAPRFEFARYRIKANPPVFAYLAEQADVFLAQVDHERRAAA